MTVEPFFIVIFVVSLVGCLGLFSWLRLSNERDLLK